MNDWVFTAISARVQGYDQWFGTKVRHPSRKILHCAVLKGDVRTLTLFLVNQLFASMICFEELCDGNLQTLR
jgi:hypothetical protein